MIKNLQLMELNRRLLLLCGVGICVVCFGGCSAPSRYGSNPNSPLSSSELEFQMHRNRPATAKTLYAMADILATQGKDLECEFVLKRIIHEYPLFLPAYNSLAALQMRQGRVNEAINTLSGALQVRPQDAVLLNNLGMCWIVRRDYEKALELFTKAASVMPENARYRANMAVALGLMGRYDESLSLLRLVMPEDKAEHNLGVLREAGKDAVPAVMLETRKEVVHAREPANQHPRRISRTDDLALCISGRSVSCEQCCEAHADEALQLCLKAGTEHQCYELRNDALEACIRDRCGLLPSICEARCNKFVGAVFKACLAEGGDEDACRERADTFLQACITTRCAPAHTVAR